MTSSNKLRTMTIATGNPLCSSDTNTPTKTNTPCSQLKPQPKSTSTSSTLSNTPSSSHSTTTSTSKTEDLMKILGPDSKLLPEERAHHEKLGLCTYCRDDHSSEKCPTKPNYPKDSSSSKSPTLPKLTSSSSISSRPKGQVAQVTEPIVEGSYSRDTTNVDFKTAALPVHQAPAYWVACLLDLPL